MRNTNKDENSLTVSFLEAFFAFALMIGLGWMLAAGLDRQIQVETVESGHVAYRLCSPLMPVFDGDKWECRS